jgi:hypothetical protein
VLACVADRVLHDVEDVLDRGVASPSLREPVTGAVDRYDVEAFVAEPTQHRKVETGMSADPRAEHDRRPSIAGRVDLEVKLLVLVRQEHVLDPAGHAVDFVGPLQRIAQARDGSSPGTKPCCDRRERSLGDLRTLEHPLRLTR